MSLLKESYKHPKTLCLILSLFFTITLPLIGWSQACSIISEIEPSSTTDFRFPFKAFNNSCDNSGIDWDFTEKVFMANDQYAHIQLNKEESSSCLDFNNLNFNLPYGAKIDGIKVEILGSTDSINSIQSLQIQLTNKDGIAVGQNKANAPSVGQEWSTDFTRWKYGHSLDNWNYNWSHEDINSANFGLRLQIKNISDWDNLIARIDEIRISVSYTPLFSLCDHDCFVFYVDDPDPQHTYNWTLPDEFEFRSQTQGKNLVNIGIGTADFGSYEICVEIIENETVIDQCCREMIIDNCAPLSIGNFVWKDENGDGIQDVGESGFPGVEVNLFDLTFNHIASTTTDQSGNYLFEGLDDGPYIVQFEGQEGYFFSPFNEDASPEENSDVTEDLLTGSTGIIKLDPGKDESTIDAGFVEASSIGDLVWEDLNGNGVFDNDESGMEGVLVLLFDEQGALISSTETDIKGNYRFENLKAGTYSLSIDLSFGFFVTYLNAGSNDEDNDFDENGMTGPIELGQGQDLNDIDAGLYKPARLGDFVWLDQNSNGIQDDNELGISNTRVILYDENQNALDTTTTSNEGIYLFVNIRPGVYYVVFETNEDFVATQFTNDEGTNSDITNSNGLNSTDNFKLVSGETNFNIDAGFIPSLGSIKGKLWEDLNYNGLYDDNESLLSQAIVQLYTAAGVLVLETLSDEDGTYKFTELEEGDYYIKFPSLDNLVFTIANAGNLSLDSDVNGDNGNGTTSTISISPGVHKENVDAGYFGYAAIGDYVWLDTNENGLQDEDESGINNVKVELYDTQGNWIAETFSINHPVEGSPGYYILTDLFPGTYYVKFSLSETDEFTQSFIGSDNTKDSDVNNSNGDGTTALFDIISSQVIDQIDAGFLDNPGKISGYTWLDENADGIRSESEVFLAEINVLLFSSLGEMISSVSTNEEGYYEFTDLASGSYYVVFEKLEMMAYSPYAIGDVSSNSDVSGSIIEGSTNLLDIFGGVELTNIDAGYTKIGGSIGDRVWIDDNSNGIQDPGESGMAEVPVFLFDSDNNMIASTLTDEKGNYLFSNLPEGQYFILFKINEDYRFTLMGQGGDGSSDSDVTSSLAAGSTDIFELGPGETNLDVDAGVFKLAFLGDYVWWDENEDGVQQDEEMGINGVKIDLYNELGEFIVSTQSTNHPETGASGYYAFNGIAPAVYTIIVELPNGFAFTNAFAGGEDEDSNIETIIDNSGSTGLIFLNSAEVIENIDFGLIKVAQGTSSIGNYVWNDKNLNGLQDETESGVNFVTLFLYNEMGEEIAMTQTGDNPESGLPGYYEFTGLNAGNYYIVVDLPNGVLLTVKEAGSDKTIDSDFILQGGDFVSSIITLGDDEMNFDIDCGLLFNYSRIGDFVWNDINGDGIQDAGEPGINDLEVHLYHANGTWIATTISEEIVNNAGFYLFENVFPGSYYIQFSKTDNDVFSPADAGGNDTKDSDITESNGPGTTNIFSIGAGEVDLDIDGGIVVAGSPFHEQTTQTNSAEIFPNPFYSHFFIKLNQLSTEYQQAELYNQWGKLVMSIDMNEHSRKEIDLTNCPAGVYWLKVEINGKIEFHKVVKQRL